MRRRLAVSIAVTVMVLVASTNAAAAPTWLPLVRLTPSSGPDGNGQEPGLAVNAAGDVVLTWDTLIDDRSTLRVVVRHAAERAWRAPFNLGVGHFRFGG